MKAKLFLSAALLSLFFLTGACGRSQNINKAGAQFYNLDSRGLSRDVPYELNLGDNLNYDSLSNHLYNISFIVRYSENCRLKMLPLDLEVIYNLEDSLIKKHLDLPLFDNNDIIEGKGAYGVYRIETPLDSNQKIDQSFSIVVTSHQEETPGILSFGVSWNNIN